MKLIHSSSYIYAAYFKSLSVSTIKIAKITTSESIFVIMKTFHVLFLSSGSNTASGDCLHLQTSVCEVIICASLGMGMELRTLVPLIVNRKISVPDNIRRQD